MDNSEVIMGVEAVGKGGRRHGVDKQWRKKIKENKI